MVFSMFANSMASVPPKRNRKWDNVQVVVVALAACVYFALDDDLLVLMSILTACGVAYKFKTRVVSGMGAAKREVRPRKAAPNEKNRTVQVSSVKPCVAPVFASVDFDAQTQELVGTLVPSTDEVAVVDSIVGMAKLKLKGLIPKAEVTGFISGDLSITAFGLAHPEIDLVISASHKHLLDCLIAQERSEFFATKRRCSMVGKMHTWASEKHALKVRKLALRAAVDHLLASNGFSFRRSHYHVNQVVLMAPVALGIHSIPIPFSVTLNMFTPFKNDRLVKESERNYSQAKELILVVRRWTKVRGISQDAKEFLSPYAWNLLVVYFLQVRNDPLLPPFSHTVPIQPSSGEAPWKKQRSSEVPLPVDAPVRSDISTGALFKDFLCFCAAFHWDSECISVRSGERLAPRPSFPINIVFNQTTRTSMATPCIEDPYEAEPTNLSANMTEVGVVRLRHELDRAAKLCEKEGSLGEIMQPFCPHLPDEEDRGTKESTDSD